MRVSESGAPKLLAPVYGRHFIFTSADGLMIFDGLSMDVPCSCSYGCVWKWLVPLNPMVLLIIIPFLNGYFIGNIPYFQTNPYEITRRNHQPGTQFKTFPGRFHLELIALPGDWLDHLTENVKLARRLAGSKKGTIHLAIHMYLYIYIYISTIIYNYIYIYLCSCSYSMCMYRYMYLCLCCLCV